MQVKSGTKQAELVLHTHLRACAASQGLLRVLPGEQTFVGKDENEQELKFAPKFLQRAIRARDLLFDVLERNKKGNEELTGDDVQAFRQTAKHPVVRCDVCSAILQEKSFVEGFPHMSNL
eukprot:333289-Amphidinium_carterae.1